MRTMNPEKAFEKLCDALYAGKPAGNLVDGFFNCDPFDMIEPVYVIGQLNMLPVTTDSVQVLVGVIADGLQNSSDDSADYEISQYLKRVTAFGADKVAYDILADYAGRYPVPEPVGMFLDEYVTSAFWSGCYDVAREALYKGFMDERFEDMFRAFELHDTYVSEGSKAAASLLLGENDECLTYLEQIDASAAAEVRGDFVHA